jgi:hypothetical protein
MCKTAQIVKKPGSETKYGSEAENGFKPRFWIGTVISKMTEIKKAQSVALTGIVYARKRLRWPQMGL